MLTTYQVDRVRRFDSLKRLLKRLFDIAVSALGLLFLSPFFAWVAYQVKHDSPGPVFYRGERIGKDGKPFKILKFRTMRSDAGNQLGPKLTAQDDPRVTAFGHWLRVSKVNELPQLWNVLVGEMSLVGPRPEDPLFADTWPRQARLEVLSMRPGITSPASVLYRDEERLLNGAQLEDTYLGEILPSKLRLDQLYVRYNSFWGDLDVIIQTLVGILPRMRNKEIGESSLFVGPVERLMRRHMRWFVIDLFVTLVAIVLAGLFWRTLGPLHVGWMLAFGIALVFATLFSLSNRLLKINSIVWSKAAASDALDLLPSALLALLAAILLNNLLPAQWVGLVELRDLPPGQVTPGLVTPWGNRSLLPNGMVLLAAGLAVMGFVFTRYRSRVITGIGSRWIHWRGASGLGRERVLIIGCGDTGQIASLMLKKGTYADSLQVVGFVDDSMHLQDSRVHGLNVLGQRQDIPDLVKELDIGILVFAIHNITGEERSKLIDICYKTGARVFEFPDIPETLHKISRANGYHNGSSSVQDQNGANEQLTGRKNPGSLSDIEDWLAQLEQVAKRGDISTTLDEIREMRSALSNKASSSVNSQETNLE